MDGEGVLLSGLGLLVLAGGLDATGRNERRSGKRSVRASNESWAAGVEVKLCLGLLVGQMGKGRLRIAWRGASAGTFPVDATGCVAICTSAARPCAHVDSSGEALRCGSERRQGSDDASWAATPLNKCICVYCAVSSAEVTGREGRWARCRRWLDGSVERVREGASSQPTQPARSSAGSATSRSRHPRHPRAAMIAPVFHPPGACRSLPRNHMIAPPGPYAAPRVVCNSNNSRGSARPRRSYCCTLRSRCALEAVHGQLTHGGVPRPPANQAAQGHAACSKRTMPAKGRTPSGGG